MEAGLDNRFWLLLILALPSAIYYTARLYDRYMHRALKGKDSDSPTTNTSRILEIAQRESGNRPPLILSIVGVTCTMLILAFGGLAIYFWIVGSVAFRIDGTTILFLVLFVLAPIAVLIDTFFLERKSYRLGRSWVFKDARAVLDGDIDIAFDRCLKALSAMKAVVIRMKRPTLVKARFGKSVIIVKLRHRSGPKVGVHVMSDSQWLTVKLDGGANQRNIDTFLSELSKH